MNKIRSAALTFSFSLLLLLQASAQSGLYLSSGSNFFISSGTAVSLDSLVLTPSAGYNLTGVNHEFRNTSVTHPLSKTYISRVFHFSSTAPAYSGTVGIYYRDSELNGLSQSNLTLNIYNGTAWNAYSGSVTRNPTINYVSTIGISSVPLTELTLANGTTASISLRDGGNSIVDEGAGLSVYPNPVVDRTIVRIRTLEPGTVKLLLYDGKGSLISGQQASLQAGVNQLQVNLGALASGTYTLQVQWKGTINVVQLVKQ